MRKLDIKEVYKYATPAYRKTFDATHLSMQFAGQIERLAGTVDSVKYDETDKNTAKVLLEFGYRSRTAVPGKIFEDTTWIAQTWIKEKGQWWHVEPK